MIRPASQGVTFGLSLGIGRCGWAVLRRPDAAGLPGKIDALGSWMFDVPETDRERTPTPEIRRHMRVARRALRRRAQRMAAIRSLFCEHGLLETNGPDALACLGIDPWQMRARGLSDRLKPIELAVALGHLAKRRGFLPSARREEQTPSTNGTIMRSGLQAMQEALRDYRTIGEMAVLDADWQLRKRNRERINDRKQSRHDVLHEARTLFEAQRLYGCRVATKALEDAYISVAFAQLSPKAVLQQAGWCQFERMETRAAKHAPSFERLRLLARLTLLRVVSTDGERPLDQLELERATADLGRTAKISVKSIRKCIGLRDDQCFATYRRDEENLDIVARSGEAMHGTKRLRSALGEQHWNDLKCRPDQLDEIANALTFYDTRESIERTFQDLNLPTGTIATLLASLDSGAFSRFRGTGHISTKACQALIPKLESGMGYQDACRAVGYDCTSSPWNEKRQATDKTSFNLLVRGLMGEFSNPVARKTLVEGLKQLWAMCNRWGLPDRVHIEMAPDVGLSLDQRQRIEWAFNHRIKQRENERKEVSEMLGLDAEDMSSDTILRFRLWKQQCGRCPFTNTIIPIASVLASDTSFQVAHILPWSRFGDDSFNNKVLCTAGSVQQKRGQTPYEWIAATEGDTGWASFVDRVESNNRYNGSKKRNFVMTIANIAPLDIRNRHLYEQRLAGRLLTEAVRWFYPPERRASDSVDHRVVCRPNAFMAALRHAWGIESLKSPDGMRETDARHHALDALAVAAASEVEIQRLTSLFEAREQQGLPYSLRKANPPWGDSQSFRSEVLEAYQTIFVARPERRRARGEGHAATIRQVREGKTVSIVYERKKVADLKENELERIKDYERNKPLIEAIRCWIANGRPLDDWPRSPAGDPVYKVRLRTNKKPSVLLRGGTADRRDVVRVDIFKRSSKRGRMQYFAVPIYPHQIANKQGWPRPPSKAVSAYVDEESWIDIDASFEFCFSLYSGSFIEIEKHNGAILCGYFNGLDRSNGAISLISDRNSKNPRHGLGIKNLLSIRKFNVDRLGKISEVRSEQRTWHGKICHENGPPVFVSDRIS